MSVVKSQRDESNLEFLYRARELRKYTIQKCVGFPKRYTFYVGQNIADLSASVLDNAKMGNDIFPRNQHEAQLRRDHFLEALAALDALVSEVELAAELFDIEEKKMLHWMSLVNNEWMLIKGVLDSDSQRFKNLPE